MTQPAGNSTLQTPVYANNLTITTNLRSCTSSVNVTQTVQDLYNLFHNNYTNSTIVSNVSILHYDCQTPSKQYFEQIITLTTAVSIRVQVALSAAYYDYLRMNAYILNGFYVESEQRFNMSSISMNYTAASDACASADAAQDPFCLSNSTTPVCITPFSNPWIYNCSLLLTTSTTSTLSTANSDGSYVTTTIASILTPWQIGLICGLSFLFLLILLLIVGCFLRRYSRSKRIALSSENLFLHTKSMRKKGIPQGQAFQRVATIVQPKANSHTPVLWIYNGTGMNTALNRSNYVNIKPAGPHNQGTFIDHAKVHDPTYPSTIFQKDFKSVPPSIKPIPPKTYPVTVVSRPVSGTSLSHLKSITDNLEEDTLNESDSISLDHSSSTNPRKLSTPVSRQAANTSFVDESLHDEDAWMSILAVANAELDVLNRLENEQNQIRTKM